MANQKVNNVFTALYANRISVAKNGVSVINLSLIFCIIAMLTASWLVIGGAIAALIMGYKFSYLRNAAGFSENLDDVVQDAKSNVRNVVDAVTSRSEQR